jgi:thiol-disulfide isomerase/thioredoxin
MSATRSKPERLVRGLTALVLAAALLQLAQTAPPAWSLDMQAPASAGPAEEIERQLEAGRQALAHHAVRPAVDAFRQANKLAHGHSTAALVGLASAYLQMGDGGMAIEYARQALASAPAPVGPASAGAKAPAASGAEPKTATDPARAAAAASPADPAQRELLVTAANLLGLALIKKSAGRAGEPPARAPLEEAVQAFRQALALSGGESDTARFNLGRALLWLSRDEEGTAALRDYLARRPEGEQSEDAKLWLANPRRARERYAPPFSLETLDGGDHVTLASLHGKITLFDFWATWCGPCVASLPSLKRIAAQMAGEPFALISVSNDQNGSKVREFVAHHGTAWTQCWDGSGQVEARFGVHGLPTFLLLDPEGKVLYAKTGWTGGREESDLLSEIHKAVKSLKAAGKGDS